ncbi:MAG: hypothetical protein DA330_02420 [Nitrososphaera sp.]|nr:hypothetical protein [Nitrososphaera sp.]
MSETNFIALLVSQIAMVDVLPYQGSILTLLVVAFIATVVLAFFRLLIPIIIAGIIIVVLLILAFGGIPIPG